MRCSIKVDGLDKFQRWNMQDIEQLLSKYADLGPIPGILVPFIESFLPFLPVILIIVGNAMVFGLWKGFLYSFIGTTAGSMCIFALSRRFGRRFSDYIARKSTRGNQVLRWIEQRGFTPLFMLSCLPLSPVFLINVVSGLSKMPARDFFLAIFFGKAFMVFLITWAGYDILHVFQHPWKFIFIVSLFLLIWLVAKKLESSHFLHKRP